MSKATIYQGDCLAIMRQMAEDGVKVQSIVTDPPYGLVSTVKRFGKEGSAPALSKGATGVYARASRGFMGQLWDGTGIEQRPETWRLCWDLLPPGGYLLAFGGTRTWHRIAVAIEDAGFEIRDTLCWLFGTGFPKSHSVDKGIDKMLGATGAFGEPKSAAHAGWISRGKMRGDDNEEGWQRPWMDDPEQVSNAARKYLPATDAARQWSGFGTALKPSFEPIIVARKPLEGTVAANVLAHGVGAINIDACRIAAPDAPDAPAFSKNAASRYVGVFNGGVVSSSEPRTTSASQVGRWPANLLLDDTIEETWARYFYSSKTNKTDRGEGNDHPTVKPTDLMAWLCRLVTPPGGTVLDPFMGSGSTGKAAIREGFNFIGTEQDPRFSYIARKRLLAAGAEVSSPLATKMAELDAALAELQAAMEAA